MTLRVAPIALGGKFFANLALTVPLFPCDLITLPQIDYMLNSRLTFIPFGVLYTYTTLFP